MHLFVPPGLLGRAKPLLCSLGLLCLLQVFYNDWICFSELFRSVAFGVLDLPVVGLLSFALRDLRLVLLPLGVLHPFPNEI